MDSDCIHTNISTQPCDQTIAVVCSECHMQLAVCWRDNHISEALWNKACKNDPSAKPCNNNRSDVCAICNHIVINNE
jgi:hypothetical protein